MRNFILRADVLLTLTIRQHDVDLGDDRRYCRGHYYPQTKPTQSDNNNCHNNHCATSRLELIDRPTLLHAISMLSKKPSPSAPSVQLHNTHARTLYICHTTNTRTWPLAFLNTHHTSLLLKIAAQHFYIPRKRMSKWVLLPPLFCRAFIQINGREPL